MWWEILQIVLLVVFPFLYGKVTHKRLLDKIESLETDLKIARRDLNSVIEFSSDRGLKARIELDTNYPKGYKSELNLPPVAQTAPRSDGDEAPWNKKPKEVKWTSWADRAQEGTVMPPD